MSVDVSAPGRRPLKSRDIRVFQRLAAALARGGVTPNAISFGSIVFGGLAGAAFAATAWTGHWTQRACWLGAGAAIQLRLLANMLDGMVAVEGKKGGPTGDLWNELPDRISDAATLIGAGYAAGSVPVLGWAAAVVALIVAYIRALGASVGVGQVFLGPQAKPHRMFVMTVAAVAGAAAPHYTSLTGWEQTPAALVGLAIVILGGMVTAVQRTMRVARLMREQG